MPCEQFSQLSCPESVWCWPGLQDVQFSEGMGEEWEDGGVNGVRAGTFKLPAIFALSTIFTRVLPGQCLMLTWTTGCTVF